VAVGVGGSAACVAATAALTVASRATWAVAVAATAALTVAARSASDGPGAGVVARPQPAASIRKMSKNNKVGRNAQGAKRVGDFTGLPFLLF
jgi:hypothetical protein